MDEAVADLVTLGLYGGVGAAVVGLVIWRVVAMSRAARAPISNEECVACGSRDVAALEPSVYRCNACGYEGGSGVATALADRERAEIDAMAPEARRAGAVTDLGDALSCLAQVEDRLASPTPTASDLDGARVELLRAEESLRRAGLKLGDPMLVPGSAAVDTTGFAAATAVDALSGQAGLALNVASLALNAAEAGSLRDRARAMAAAAHLALGRVGGSPAA